MMFSTLPKTNFNFSDASILSSANAVCLDQSEILSFGRVNSLPYTKILDQSKMEDYEDDKINLTQILNFVLKREENIVGKGEHAGNQHFLLFPQYFQKLSFQGH